MQTKPKKLIITQVVKINDEEMFSIPALSELFEEPGFDWDYTVNKDKLQGLSSSMVPPDNDLEWIACGNYTDPTEIYYNYDVVFYNVFDYEVILHR